MAEGDSAFDIEHFDPTDPRQLAQLVLTATARAAAVDDLREEVVDSKTKVVSLTQAVDALNTTVKAFGPALETVEERVSPEHMVSREEHRRNFWAGLILFIVTIGIFASVIWATTSSASSQRRESRRAIIAECHVTENNTRALSDLLDSLTSAAEGNLARAKASPSVTPQVLALAQTQLDKTKAFVSQREAVLPHPNCAILPKP